MTNKNKIKPHFFILLTIQFNVRIFLRTGIIERLLKFSDVTVVLFWHNEKLEKELHDIGCKVILQVDLPKLNKLLKISRSIKTNLHHKKNIDHSSFRIEKENYFFISQKKQKENFKYIFYDIIVKFNAQMLNANNFQVIVNLSEMFKDSAEIGDMEYDIFKFNINSLDTYEKDLIIRE